MDAGDTFYIPNPGTTLDSHLWIVVSDPNAFPEQVVIVNMTSHRDDKDQACILEVGDHSFIKHKSCIEYSRAKVLPVRHLAALVDKGITQGDKCSAELLQKIRDGVPDSRMELDKVAILEMQGLVNL